MTTPDDRIASYIDRLVEDARPVRRLWPPILRLTGWLGVVLVVGVALWLVGLRQDVVARLTAPRFCAELVCLGGAALVAAWLALRGAVPGLDGGSGRLVLVGTIATAMSLCLVQSPAPATSLFVLRFVEAGVPCAGRALLLVVAPWAALLWAVRRGAPLRPTSTYALGGLAASLAAYALMRLRCGLDEPFHVVVWHGAPVLLATAVAAAVGLASARSHRVPTSPP
jgi:hypothetical protein